MVELVSLEGLRYDGGGLYQAVWDAFSYENYVYLGRNPFPTCIAQVYSSLAAAGLAVPPGPLHATSVQNDFLGLQAAYDAWRSSEMLQPSPPLDLRLTNDQLWWVAAQQWKCTALDEAMSQVEPRDPHTVVRGNAALSTAFATAFACPSGSPMNPGASCKQSL
eukprot:GGOE01060982.1.p1 GENE.GGOE01060982.1~~GGOE01060982.1.p1  ORF type:complete len:177 (-),score=39.53 GGOE01060982.1:246-734(-)